MSTLQEGQLLLDRIREMGVHADVQNRHATTAACYGIEHLLELLQDRRRHLEELWLQRKVRLEQCLQLLLLDQEVNKVRTTDVERTAFSLSLFLSRFITRGYLRMFAYHQDLNKISSIVMHISFR